MANYRPISLLMGFLKFFRKQCTVGYNNSTLFSEQYSFRAGVSTENVAFRLPDNVFKSINQEMHVGVIFCDLAKASDCVNHETLLAFYISRAFKEYVQIGAGPV
jgi:hypothetical protein